MDIHHRKLLILGKINSYNNNDNNNNNNNSQATEDQKDGDPCGEPCLPPSVYIDYYPLPPPPPPPPGAAASHNSSSILILTLCILGVAFVLVSYFSIVRYRSKNSRRDSQPVNDTRDDFIDENHGPVVDHPIWYIRTVGLQQSVIDSIAVFKYKRDEGLIEGTDCSVCLSEFQEDENLRLLPKCSHAFHIHCIDTWLSSHKNCPICRAPIVSDANSANSVQGNVGETNLTASSSVEENEAESAENRGERVLDEVEENRTSEMRVGGESIGSLPIEERYDDRVVADKDSCHQPARKNKVRVKRDLAGHSVKLDEEMEPVRRSISMDASSASMVYLAVASKCPVEGEGSSNMVQTMRQNSERALNPGIKNSSIYRLVKSSSLGRSLQMVPVSIKRSFSSSGKSSLPTHSRTQDSD